MASSITSCAIICIIFANISPGSAGYVRRCEPVVRAGKEVPQMRTYHADDKRFYGKPGNGSHLIHKQICVNDTASELPEQPHDCADIKAKGMNVSGVYGISPEGNGLPFNVYCDMDTDGGGWTVFQRRMDGSVDFNRKWLDYKNGFGSVSSEHWLGNEKVHRLSNQNIYELRVDLEWSSGRTSFATYNRFGLGNETSNYLLSLGRYSGKAGNTLRRHSGNQFSTRDRDNDNSISNCASYYRAGWWFTACLACNLNGLYPSSSAEHNLTEDRLLTWGGRINDTFGVLKWTEMKIRPVTTK